MGNDSGKDDLNVEEIMSTIREKVRKKHNLPSRCRHDLEDETAGDPSGWIREEIRRLESVQNREDAGYDITSHRALAGPLLVKGRKLVNGEVRRYVDPRLWKQREINLGIIRVADQIIASTDMRLDDMNEKISKMQEQLEKNASWSEFYHMEVSEQFLNDNVAFHKEFVELIVAYARKSSGGRVPKLLEVGLGTATFSIHFSRNAYDCVGIDNDPHIILKSLETNRSLGGYSRFLLIDALDLDLLKDGYFDVAFSQGTLEHFDNETMTRLLSKQLKVARYVVFSVPSPQWPGREFGNERKISVEEWRVLLESGGFNVLHLDYYHEKTQIACVLGPGLQTQTQPGALAGKGGTDDDS
jgi:SAM-dependent methyltransferase